MSLLSRLTAGITARQAPRRTIRLRLTVLYGALFLASGAALLAVTYFLVDRAVPGTLARDVVVPKGGAPAPPSGTPSGQPGPGLLPGGEQSGLLRQKSAVMDALLVQSGIALALMLGISIVLGWIVAGRILRPLRTITAAAQDISATSLHQRLALAGPHDELKELGDTFDSLLHRLEASFDAQRRFVANASHELRTPLARQRTLGQVALSDPEATVASLRAAHERILATGAQQERLLEALLTLARGQGGIDVRQPFDLAALTQQVLDSRAAEAQARQVALLPSVGPAVAAGHRNLAERLVTNLVDNAMRHNRPDGWIEVATTSTGGHASVTVTNTGPRVPPQEIERLFQPFQRLTDNRAARAEGLGLGLSIVLAIATAHDATVSTRARPEGGLTVTVTFPPVSAGAYPVGRRPEERTAGRTS